MGSLFFLLSPVTQTLLLGENRRKSSISSPGVNLAGRALGKEGSCPGPWAGKLLVKLITGRRKKGQVCLQLAPEIHIHPVLPSRTEGSPHQERAAFPKAFLSARYHFLLTFIVQNQPSSSPLSLPRLQQRLPAHFPHFQAPIPPASASPTSKEQEISFLLLKQGEKIREWRDWSRWRGAGSARLAGMAPGRGRASLTCQENRD